MQPYNGARTGGAAGFFKGLGKGTLYSVTKTSAGICSSRAKLAIF